MHTEPELRDSGNPSGLDGIEFVEYATARPLALGHVLELMGFQPVARHRSREVLLYRQGAMNIVINGHGIAAPAEAVRISAVALRTRDAAAAYRRALDRGAWAVPRHVEVMELNIPAIHGVGATRIYFVDRHREFSIYTVDFVPLPSAAQAPPALAGMRWFGLVQYVSPGRMTEWTAFYHELFAFLPVPADQRFGILPGGEILRSPCGSFYLQLIEPSREPASPDALGAGWLADERIAQRRFADERIARVGLGAEDVSEAVRVLRARGVAFIDTGAGLPTERGALTREFAGGVMFELVRDPRPPVSPP